MAEIVLGVASSHGPTLSTPARGLRFTAERDRGQDLVGPDGELKSYVELEAAAGPASAEWIDIGSLERRLERCQAGMHAIGQLVADASPDVVVIVGNDHDDMLFTDFCRPAFAVFTGSSVKAYPWKIPPVPPFAQEWLPTMWRRHFGTDGETIECAADLGRHVVLSMIEDEFDVAHFSDQPEGRTIGEAFLFPYHRYLEPAGIRVILPVVFNTFEPEQPNQPTPRRCYAFGRALRRAIDSWPSQLRVALLASGGLSHFLVDEELDRITLSALESGDPEAIAALPRRRLRGGNTEARNWIAAAGAMQGQRFELIEYIPVQRSAAGTGAAMAFGRWA